MCDVDNELSDQNKPQERSLSCCSCSFQPEDIHIGLDRCYVEKASGSGQSFQNLKRMNCSISTSLWQTNLDIIKGSKLKVRIVRLPFAIIFGSRIRFTIFYNTNTLPVQRCHSSWAGLSYYLHPNIIIRLF